MLSDINAKRREYIRSISDKKRRAQSYCVWKLLEYVLDVNYPSIEKQFSRLDCGEWLLDGGKPKFSLTHSHSIVAVAVSDCESVGVDAEVVSDKIVKVQRLFAEFGSDLDKERLTEEWTKKESLYKSKTGDNFFTRKVYDECGNKYCLSVCTNCENVVFYEINSNDYLGDVL